MEKHIACCGIVCSECPAFIATVNNDDDLRKSTAETWSKNYSTALEAKDIQCKGCLSDTLFSYCGTCNIRDCSTSKGLKNCSGCDSYGCDKIEDFFKMVPDAKAVLDNMR